MLITRLFKKRIFSKSRIQDIIFLIGIFLFSAVLILSLFPRTESEDTVSRIYFFYLIGTIPVIAAVYFIIVSFRRQIYASASDIGSSIRFKIALAFVFVAVLPSLPIIILSNRIINNTLSELISERNTQSIEESLQMAHECIEQEYSGIRQEICFIDRTVKGRPIEGSRELRPLYESKGFGMVLYRAEKIAFEGNTVLPADRDSASNEFAPGFGTLLAAMPVKERIKVYTISIKNNPIIAGRLAAGGTLIVLYKKIPPRVFERIALYEETMRRYKQREFLKTYFQTGLGIFLMLLSIVIIILSITMSYFLSRGITRPVFELISAAKQVAGGNFNIHLARNSQDEIALLFDSFNRMVAQLEESRLVVYQTQKLQAWREMARKLMHEIKNPLTPIRLSAERIQLRYREGHPDIANIIQTGTETIIDEVNVLKQILSEFSNFARLPEMRPEPGDINQKIINCVNFFMGHERITFHLNLDDDIPEIYFDKILMRQALTNMIQNSIEAIRNRGDIFIKSELTYYGGERIVKISIRDNGIGIREEHLPKIFEPTFSLKESGTGLGLAIVEKIILEHRGRIFCRSRYGEGTEFIIELPIQKPEDSHGKNPDSRR